MKNIEINLYKLEKRAESLKVGERMYVMYKNGTFYIQNNDGKNHTIEVLVSNFQLEKTKKITTIILDENSTYSWHAIGINLMYKTTIVIDNSISLIITD